MTQHSKRCWHRLRHIARSALRGDSVATELEAGCGTVVIATPINHRQRIVGAVLACGLTREFLDEESLARFCGLHAVDRPVVERLAADASLHDAAQLHAYADILHHHIASLSAGALACRDIRDLSAHLARAYEELNLIYRLSEGMTVSRRPAACLERMSIEVLDATVVESLATILTPPPEYGPRPTVITAGPLDAGHEELVRLYRDALALTPNADGALVVDDVAGQPQLAWAAGWAQRLVLCPLSRSDRPFGGLLAINRTDGRDFGSDQVQLLRAVAERASAFLENIRLYDDLEQLFMGMLHALVNSVDAKDPYTCGHSQRVAWLSRYIATLAGVTQAECQRVYLSGLLHDVGKIGVAEAVLRKTGRLTADEYQEMKRHPEVGARILEGVRQVDDLLPGVLYHHERVDGKGYPRGLNTADVPLYGRIVGLADSFDAMTTSRTYRRALPVQVAAAEIRRCAGTQFDPALTEMFLQADMHGISEKLRRSGRQEPDPITDISGERS